MELRGSTYERGIMINKILDSVDAEISRAVEIEERIYSLLGETREGWQLIAELGRLNFEIGVRVGVYTHE